jgi:8-oxo-dGTP diphosphatase
MSRWESRSRCFIFVAFSPEAHLFEPMNPALPYKISVLVFIQDSHGRQLLLERTKSPNAGCWSPIGGKLEMATGESPFECARRETAEETGLVLGDDDLHLWGMIAEKSYEGSGHWLMFMFDAKKRIDALPETIDEGHFAFYSDSEIDHLLLPDTDRQALWPLYRKFHKSFVCLRADCEPDKPLEVIVEQLIRTGSED